MEECLDIPAQAYAQNWKQQCKFFFGILKSMFAEMPECFQFYYGPVSECIKVYLYSHVGSFKLLHIAGGYIEGCINDAQDTKQQVNMWWRYWNSWTMANYYYCGSSCQFPTTITPYLLLIPLGWGESRLEHLYIDLCFLDQQMHSISYLPIWTFVTKNSFT